MILAVGKDVNPFDLPWKYSMNIGTKIMYSPLEQSMIDPRHCDFCELPSGTHMDTFSISNDMTIYISYLTEKYSTVYMEIKTGYFLFFHSRGHFVGYILPVLNKEMNKMNNDRQI